jgi:outer membrane autotransporter protein
MLIGPIASLRYTYVTVDEFTEKGSAAPMHVEDNDSMSLLSRLGARVAWEIPTGKIFLRPELRLAWQHEFLDTSAAIDSRFASGAGSVFRVNGSEVGRDSLSVGAGFSIQCSKDVLIYAYYNGEYLQNNFQAHTVNGGFAISF